MKYCVDRYRPACPALVKDSIWKAPHQGSAISLMNDWEHLRSAANARNTGIDRTQKFFAESDSSTLVPGVSFCNVQPRFWSKNQFNGHTGRALFVSPLPTREPTPGPA